MAELIQLKKCSKCKAEKPVNQFHSDRSRMSGLNAKCKECESGKYTARSRYAEVIAGETWRDVAGFEGKYSVSNFGRVRRDMASRGATAGALLRLRPNKLRYLRVSLRDGEKTTDRQVHRLVAQAFIEPCEGREVVNHKDGNPSNNDVNNLEWVTHQENVTHARSVLQVGAKKLTEPEVVEIRRDYDSGSLTRQEIAKRRGLDWSTVNSIVKREIWKHI